MTRFTLTINQAITFTLNSVSMMIGGEIFVPKIPSYNILQLAKCMNPNATVKIIGKRPGEKLHEAMISTSESFRTIIKDDYFVVIPEIIEKYTLYYGDLFLQEDTEYTSGSNTFISDEVLRNLVNPP
jgi:UDP-N-acetylglucosamine 4,6-dehydratase